MIKLERGETYVIEVPFCISNSLKERYLEMLKCAAKEVNFIILDAGVTIARPINIQNSTIIIEK